MTGDIEGLLTGALSRVKTVHARLREWSDPEVARAAIERVELGGGAYLPETEESELESEHWFAPPDRVREERVGMLTVRRERTWWTHHPALGVITNEDDPNQTTSGGELIRLLTDPSPIVALVDLSVVDTTTFLGRPALRVDATPKYGPGADFDLSFLGSYADKWELVVDAERGVILSATALGAGAPFQVIEATEVEFDEELDDALFTFQAPAGE